MTQCWKRKKALSIFGRNYRRNRKELYRRCRLPASKLLLVKRTKQRKEQSWDIWINDVYFDGEKICGRWINEAQNLVNLREGEQVCLAPKQLSDWLFAMPDEQYGKDINRSYGGFTVQAIRAQMSDAERAEHDVAWGLYFGDYNEMLIAHEQKEHPENLIKHPMSQNLKESLIAYLTENPVTIFAQDTDDYTLLHREAIAGNLNSVTVLCEHGADIRAQTKNGKTALDFAQQIGWEHIVSFLEQTE